MSALGVVDGLKSQRVRDGVWLLDDTDFFLAALLQDPIYAAELLWDDPTNHDYGGCYRVRDYQYPLFRSTDNYQGFACARTVGKTESIKAKAFTVCFRLHGQGMLLTAPELIHLIPLTDAVELRIRDCRLTSEMLDKRNQRTGFTHRPFGVDYIDGTKLIGRIPRLAGTGVKGQHVPELIVDEGQDYPEKGWTEVHETVMKDTVDATGKPSFRYEFYGVHSGARNSGFYSRATQGAFKMTQITAIQRPGWGQREKEAAKAAYGSTASPDYRRNILGEPGSPASTFFVVSRLAACTDQNRESAYNDLEYQHQEFRVEEFDDIGLPLREVLHLPLGYKRVWAGADIGLTNAPTVISLFSQEVVDRKERLKLFRLIVLHRFRSRHIVDAWAAIGETYGTNLEGFGIDSTGLGFPIMQAIEDDQRFSKHLAQVTRGYFFNSKLPVDVAQANITHDQGGEMRDQYGAVVKEEIDPITGYRRFVTYMSMVEASTRYLREWVDTGYLLLPFDGEIHRDMMGETAQRVKSAGELRRKPNMFHILDSFRSMAMVYKREQIEEILNAEPPAVLDLALDDFLGGGVGGQEIGSFT